MLDALELVIRLLEKVSVLVASALVLLMLRPAEVWLGETGSEASLRRRAFLVAVLGGLAIWGVFLGFEVDGLRFNVRMVGIIVAGYLGGAWVGIAVGLAAGALSAMAAPTYATFTFVASVLTGLLSGLWSRWLGTGVVSVVGGAVAIQLAYHAGLGGIFAALRFEEALRLAGRVELHAAKIAANAVGVTVFMGLLKLVRELELAREEARTSRAMVRSARLEALRYQIRPHFLFNVLNTLAYLIRTAPARAREVTLELAEFLRFTLGETDEETTLREELDQLERYVDLERARFGDGLEFEVGDLPSRHAAEASVPPLILQPLVENAIRHGSGGTRADGAGNEDAQVKVRVEVDEHDDHLDIRVLDDGPGPPENWQASSQSARASREGGVGLENVRERLQRYYHGRSQLTLRDREDGSGACAQFTIPLEMPDEDVGLKKQAREQLKKVIT
jgi:LytS/YehU family sensor histidine kinase